MVLKICGTGILPVIRRQARCLSYGMFILSLAGLVILWQCTGEPPALPIAQSELEIVWQPQDLDKVITTLRARQHDQPANILLKAQLAQAYEQKALALQRNGSVKESIFYMEQSLALIPQQSKIEQEIILARKYLDGLTSYQAGQWTAAITIFEDLARLSPHYVNSKDLLYSAYFNEGQRERATGNLFTAHERFKTALALRPDLGAPRWQIAEIEAIPNFQISLQDKFMVVGLVEQRMWAYQNGYRRYDFIVKTGGTDEETMPGNFEIQNKIESANGLGNLKLPYWLGIYWVDDVQNGIHGPPIELASGTKLWDGELREQASHGCIVLNDEDSLTLYQWAEVGVKVEIVPSLAKWNGN